MEKIIFASLIFFSAIFFIYQFYKSHYVLIVSVSHDFSIFLLFSLEV